MTAADDEARIRERAHALWEAEGRPEGRAEAHWQMAREVVATEDSLGDTLRPVDDPLATSPTGQPVEPALALDNQGEMPGLTDQGEDAPSAPHPVGSAKD